jgi:hypothetical protein
MSLTEDLDIFLADFGVSCTAGAVSAMGILDMPSQILSDGMVLSTDYTLTARASDFGDLIYGSQINVNGVAYTVRETQLIDDGKMVQIALQRSVEVPSTTAVTSLDGDDADGLITDEGIEQLDPELDGGSAGSSYLDGNDFDGGAA